MGNRVIKTTVCNDCTYKVDGNENETGFMWCEKHNDVCRHAINVCEYSMYTYDKEKFEKFDKERE